MTKQLRLGTHALWIDGQHVGDLPLIIDSGEAGGIAVPAEGFTITIKLDETTVTLNSPDPVIRELVALATQDRLAIAPTTAPNEIAEAESAAAWEVWMDTVGRP